MSRRSMPAGTRSSPASSSDPSSVSDQPVLYRVEGGIAWIELNRPAVHNALAPQSVRALARAWQAIALDRKVRVAILHAAGDSFCSGRDLRETDLGFGPRQRPGKDPVPDDDWGSRPGEARRIHYVPPPTLHKPVIAAVQGLALGGGMELALNCDIRIAAKDARFGLPEVTRGVVPGSGGLYWLPRVVGAGLAMEMMLTGRIVDACEALAMRLVSRVVDRDELLQGAEAIARHIAQLPPLAVQAVKETVLRTMGAGVEEGLRMGEQQNRVLQMTRDAEEGALAFEQKRTPKYEGR
jgi:enoyl-CoA hydratase/carnithine racemase